MKVCDKTCIFFFFPIINKYVLMAKRSLLSRCPRTSHMIKHVQWNADKTQSSFSLGFRLSYVKSLTSRPSYSTEWGYHCTLVRRMHGPQIFISAVKNRQISVIQGTEPNRDIPFIHKAVAVLTSLGKLNLFTVWGSEEGFGLQKYQKHYIPPFPQS